MNADTHTRSECTSARLERGWPASAKGNRGAASDIAPRDLLGSRAESMSFTSDAAPLVHQMPGVEASGATLAELFADLDRRYPGLRFRVINEQDEIPNTSRYSSINASRRPRGTRSQRRSRSHHHAISGGADRLCSSVAILEPTVPPAQSRGAGAQPRSRSSLRKHGSRRGPTPSTKTPRTQDFIAPWCFGVLVVRVLPQQTSSAHLAEDGDGIGVPHIDRLLAERNLAVLERLYLPEG